MPGSGTDAYDEIGLCMFPFRRDTTYDIGDNAFLLNFISRFGIGKADKIQINALYFIPANDFHNE
jgi:hypothetical protein